MNVPGKISCLYYWGKSIFYLSSNRSGLDYFEFLLTRDRCLSEWRILLNSPFGFSTTFAFWIWRILGFLVGLQHSFSLQLEWGRGAFFPAYIFLSYSLWMGPGLPVYKNMILVCLLGKCISQSSHDRKLMVRLWWLHFM